MSDPRSSPPPAFSRLYPILDSALETEESMLENAAALARAGCRLMQLRAKELAAGDFHRWAEGARAVSRREGMRLLINDRVDVALLVGADGVHLGQDDLPPESARKLLGAEAIIGLSTHDVGQARAAEAAPVDYVAIGPIFASTTKKGHHPELGIEGLRAVRAVVKKPLVAIGGISRARAAEVLGAGADAVAVISALKSGPDVELVARDWLALGLGESGEGKGR